MLIALTRKTRKHKKRETTSLRMRGSLSAMAVKPVEQDLVRSKITIAAMSCRDLDHPDLAPRRLELSFLFPDLVDREVLVFLSVDHQNRGFGESVDDVFVQESAHAG